MTNYRRITIAGGTYFFTQVTHQRYPWLCGNTARTLLRDAITHVRQKYPFTIDALVLLPDHLHCIWTLPPGDSDYATRWRLIKTYVTKHRTSTLAIDASINDSRQKRQESNLWQRRFWEYWIRDRQILSSIVITSITIQLNMDCVLHLLNGHIPVFIALLHRASMRQIGDRCKHRKSQ